MNWTQEQIVMSNVWARGSMWFPIRKVGNSKWIITNDGIWSLLGNVPTVFKTKRAAIEFCNNLCMIRFEQWGPKYND